MRQEFIEGTNKQYSIREDGVIIRHRSIRSLKPKLYDFSDGRRVMLYLSDSKSYVYYNNIFILLYKTFIDANYDSKGSYIVKYRNSLHVNNLYLEYRYDNRLSINRCLTKKEGSKLNVINITKAYVASNLELKVSELPDEVYKIYKKNLILKRKLRLTTTYQERKLTIKSIL